MESRVLYVNACVRQESRTRSLAEKLLEKLGGTYEEVCLEAQKAGKAYEEVRLEDIAFPVANEEFLKKRDRLIAEGAFEDPMFALARQFAEANVIVIAAPYWDLSFPAMLKQYLEQVNVVGITFKYSEEGIPIGLCKAGRIYYVTTAGGPFAPDAFGFGYVQALAQNYYGIRDVRKIEALGLDIVGADVEAIMKEAEDSLAELC